jgi:hypothetical protein
MEEIRSAEPTYADSVELAPEARGVQLYHLSSSGAQALLGR